MMRAIVSASIVTLNASAGIGRISLPGFDIPDPNGWLTMHKAELDRVLPYVIELGWEPLEDDLHDDPLPLILGEPGERWVPLLPAARGCKD